MLPREMLYPPRRIWIELHVLRIGQFEEAEISSGADFDEDMNVRKMFSSGGHPILCDGVAMGQSQQPTVEIHCLRCVGTSVRHVRYAP